MILLALDPGTHETALLQYDTDSGSVLWHAIKPNEQALEDVLTLTATCDHLAVEMVACYGMPVGAETFETVLWLGRFIQAWRGPWSRVYRSDVKSYLCRSARAKDANVRQALLDRFGGSRKAALGTKRQPGPLYGVRSHCWSALAVAVTWSESEKFAGERQVGAVA